MENSDVRILFENELGNKIAITVWRESEQSTDRVTFKIEGPGSAVESEITLVEARWLRTLLGEMVKEPRHPTGDPT